jgi:DNA-binding IclR family transcriptional regulator
MVKSVERAMSLLRVISGENGHGTRLTDAARTIGLSKSTTHRLLSALISSGHVQQNLDTGRFHLGPEAISMAILSISRHNILDVARPAMVRLAERSADTVYLTVRAGLEAVCLGREEGSFPIKILSLTVGTRRPLCVGAGNLSMLAALPDAEVERAIAIHGAALAQNWGVSGDTIRDLVKATRKQGYAYVMDIFVPGMAAIGVAVTGSDGAPYAAFSIASVPSRLMGERRANVVNWLQSEARFVAELNSVSRNLQVG